MTCVQLNTLKRFELTLLERSSSLFAFVIARVHALLLTCCTALAVMYSDYLCSDGNRDLHRPFPGYLLQAYRAVNLAITIRCIAPVFQP